MILAQNFYRTEWIAPFAPCSPIYPHRSGIVNVSKQLKQWEKLWDYFSPKGRENKEHGARSDNDSQTIALGLFLPKKGVKEEVNERFGGSFLQGFNACLIVEPQLK